MQSLKYLGSIISAGGSSDEDIEQRIGAATRVVGAMGKEVIKRHISRLQACEMMCLRGIGGLRDLIG